MGGALHLRGRVAQPLKILLIYVTRSRARRVPPTLVPDILPSLRTI